jgi:hypothetical protein
MIQVFDPEYVRPPNERNTMKINEERVWMNMLGSIIVGRIAQRHSIDSAVKRVSCA